MNLEPMWAKLAEYQPHAEKRGFGEAWLRMTTERTADAAADAANAAWAADEAWSAYAAAWVGAEAAVWAARSAANAAAAEWAITHITRAIEQETEPDASPSP